MIQDAYALRDQRKVAQVEPYLPGPNGSLTRQPIIVILQDQWMFRMCDRLLQSNSWEIYSTFKTNQFRLSLYVVIEPNVMGFGIPL